MERRAERRAGRERDLRKIIDRRRPSKERRREGGEREPRGWRRLNRIRIGDAPVTFVLLPFQNGRGSWIYKGRGVVVQVWEEEDYGSCEQGAGGSPPDRLEEEDTVTPLLTFLYTAAAGEETTGSSSRNE